MLSSHSHMASAAAWRGWCSLEWGTEMPRGLQSPTLPEALPCPHFIYVTAWLMEACGFPLISSPPCEVGITTISLYTDAEEAQREQVTIPGPHSWLVTLPVQVRQSQTRSVLPIMTPRQGKAPYGAAPALCSPTPIPVTDPATPALQSSASLVHT